MSSSSLTIRIIVSWPESESVFWLAHVQKHIPHSWRLVDNQVGLDPTDCHIQVFTMQYTGVPDKAAIEAFLAKVRMWYCVKEPEFSERHLALRIEYS